MRDLFRLERENLKKGIYSAKPDILHAHWTYEFALACLETNYPTIVTVRDNAFQILRFKTDLYRLGRLYLQMRVLRKARFLTVVSPYLANSFGRILDYKTVEVIPNTVEVPTKLDRQSSHIFEIVRIVTANNGFQNRKNPKTAIRAFNLLLRRKPSAEMFMYGTDFEENGPAARWAKRKHLAANVTFCGPLLRQDLLRELTNSSIFLHPALEESFGMVVAEAMAHGVPVVAGTKSGGVPWVLDAGSAGYLTDVRDPAKVTATLVDCIENSQDREQRRRNAYERVRSVFSPDSVAAQYEQVYAKALAN